MPDERPIGPYWKEPAKCLPYDPRAPQVARRVAALVTARLPWTRVEHVGSTSIPSCDGKGVVDLMIPFHDEADLAAIKDALADLGCQRQQSRDPWPEDRPMRTGSLEHDGAAFRLHIHVVPAGTHHETQLIEFREAMRRDPARVAAYVALKRRIIAQNPRDAEEYSVLKGEFFAKP